MVIGLVQLQLPDVATPEQLAAQTRRVCELVGKDRRQSPVMDLVDGRDFGFDPPERKYESGQE